MFDEEALPESASDEQLVATVEERIGGVGRTLAIKELGRRRSPLSTDVLTRLVSDRTEPEDVRTAATVALGHQDSEAAREALVAALSSREASVAHRAAEALGRVGDANALNALESATVPEGPVSRSAGFAQSLIAYRLGIDDHRLPRPSEDALLDPDSENTEPVEVRTPDTEELRRAIADLERDLPSMTASSGGALSLTCGNSEYVVVLNGELQRGEPLQRLQGAPAMPAVVLKLSGGLDRFYLHAYTLTHPVGPGDLELLVTRTTGDTVLFGSARIENGRATFSLRATATPYSPTADLEGTFDGTQLELTSARVIIQRDVGSPRSGARSPRKVDVFES